MTALMLEAALRSLALGVVVWLALLALRPRNPHLQKTVWITVLLASLAMPFVLNWRVAPSFELPAYVMVFASAGGAEAAGSDTASRATPLLAQLPIGAISAIYALVTLTLLARFAIGLVSIWRLRRAATPLPRAADDAFDIRVSTKVLSPATFGSTILLPASISEMSKSQLTAVLSHERSHVRNRDCYVQWLANLHACIFWFSPFAWWLHRRLAELAETTSDDAVVETMPDRTAYAELLLEIARNPTPGRVVMSMARPNISARIERIVSNIPPSSPPRRWVRGLAVAMLIPPFIMAAATAQTPAAAPPVPAAAPAAHTNTQIPERFRQQSPNPDPMAPKVLEYGDLAHLEAVYPVEAKRLAIEGIVTISVMLDADGRVLDATVVDEFPDDRDYGFGAAARTVAYTMRFSNPRHEVTRTQFRVKFALSK